MLCKLHKVSKGLSTGVKKCLPSRCWESRKVLHVNPSHEVLTKIACTLHYGLGTSLCQSWQTRWRPGRGFGSASNRLQFGLPERKSELYQSLYLRSKAQCRRRWLQKEWNPPKKWTVSQLISMFQQEILLACTSFVSRWLQEVGVVNAFFLFF